MGQFAAFCRLSQPKRASLLVPVIYEYSCYYYYHPDNINYIQ